MYDKIHYNKKIIKILKNYKKKKKESYHRAVLFKPSLQMKSGLMSVLVQLQN